MPTIRFAIALFLLGSSATLASEHLFVGRVQSILLLPEGHERCPSPCTGRGEATEGLDRICVHNSCGCGEATLAVQETLVGKPTKHATVGYRLGEWCMPDFPLSQESILVWNHPEHFPRWSSLTREGDSLFYDPEEFDGAESELFSAGLSQAGKSELAELRRRVGL
jgi:hypothetical protein